MEVNCLLKAVVIVRGVERVVFVVVVLVLSWSWSVLVSLGQSWSVFVSLRQSWSVLVSLGQSWSVFWACLSLFQITIECFRTLKPISGGAVGRAGGYLRLLVC